MTRGRESAGFAVAAGMGTTIGGSWAIWC